MLSESTVERIRTFRENRFPVLSVYLNLAPDIREMRTVRPRLKDLLKDVRATAESSGLDHAAAMSLRADAQRVLDLEQRIESDVGHGVAVFTCGGAKFFEYLSMPRAVWDVAVANTSPYMRPIDALLNESYRACTVVVDQRRAWIFACDSGSVEVVAVIDDESLRKNNFGGWYGLEEHRVRRHSTELSQRHYRDTIKLIANLSAERGFDLLVIGGQRAAADAFTSRLPQNLRSRHAGTFTVDPATMTPAIALEHTRRVQHAWVKGRQEEEAAAIARAAGAGAPVALGLVRVLDAANARAVDRLVVETSLSAPGRVCEGCGWLGLSGDQCPACGDATRATPDVIDDLVSVTVHGGGTVTHLWPPSDLASTSIGAMLRFPVPQ